MKSSKYETLGASASKSGLHDALAKAGFSDDQGLFAKVTPDFAGDPDYLSVLHCDGAGTKSIVSYLYFKATGSRELFARLAQDALVMNLDDVYCIGRPESLVLANAIARNARLIDDEIIANVIRSYRELSEKLHALGIPLTISGGETADCGDLVRTLLVDAVIAGRIKKSQLIDANRITAGDVIVGLSSTGQASYETEPNSGISSNGLTLARHALLTKAYIGEYPEAVDSGIDSSAAYSGPFRVEDRPEQLGTSIGEALSSPTRTYAPVLAAVYQELGNEKIHGAIHLTGGGQTKMLRFGKSLRYVKNNLFPVPPLFALIQEHGGVDWKEMYQVFNMGHRMELYLAESDAQRVIEISQGFGITAQVVGHVEQSSTGKNSLRLESSQGSFDYEL